eukprot:4777674-Amphidinium_carterae.1
MVRALTDEHSSKLITLKSVGGPVGWSVQNRLLPVVTCSLDYSSLPLFYVKMAQYNPHTGPLAGGKPKRPSTDMCCSQVVCSASNGTHIAIMAAGPTNSST